MPIALHVDQLEDDGTIAIRHTFFGETLHDCERLRDEHAAGCPALGPHLKSGRIIEVTEEVDEIPEWEE